MAPRIGKTTAAVMLALGLFGLGLGALLVVLPVQPTSGSQTASTLIFSRLGTAVSLSNDEGCEGLRCARLDRAFRDTGTVGFVRSASGERESVARRHFRSPTGSPSLINRAQPLAQRNATAP